MLTEIQIKAAKPREKVYYLSDGRGLLLAVKPNGAKCWIARIFDAGKEKRRGLGTWPDVPLRRARELCVDAKRSPGGEAVPKFEEVAARWYTTQIARRSESHRYETQLYLDRHLLPALGSLRVDEITPAICLDHCQQLCDEGHLSAARLVRQILVRILDFAVVAGYIPANPAAAIRRMLPSPPEQHFAAPSDPALLMRRITALPDGKAKFYLQLLAFFFCRPSELIGAMWSEFDGDVWSVPAERMKGRRPHFVPVAPQAASVLSNLSRRDYSPILLFPCDVDDCRPFSAAVPRRALLRAGYRPGEITLHGFRAMASTALNSEGFPSAVVEAQLAHIDRDKTRRAYNRADYLPQRVEMMRFWADYLTRLLQSDG